MKVLIKSNLQKKFAELNKAGENINRLMPKQIFRALTLLETAMKQNIRTDLNVRSGTLLNSVQKDLRKVGPNEWEGEVGPSGNVPYAGVQNWGHTFPARFVAPRNKLALKWTSGGKTFFSKGHTIPSFKVPGVHYLENAIEMVNDKIEKDLGIFIEDQLRKA